MRSTHPAMSTVSMPRFRAAPLAQFAVAWLAAIVAAGAVLVVRPQAVDAHVYWMAWHGPLYANGFVYPPPGALLFAPAAILPWPVFLAAWYVVLGASAAWLLWPLPVRLRVPWLIALFATLTFTNAATLLAVPLALAPRWPALWAVLAWTKVTPGVAMASLVRPGGLRKLAVGLGASAAIGLAVLVAAPTELADWLRLLAAHPEIPMFLPGFQVDVPLAARLVLAGAIAWLGASRPWTLAIAATLAVPDLSLATCGLLAAAPRLAASSAKPG